MQTYELLRETEAPTLVAPVQPRPTARGVLPGLALAQFLELRGYRTFEAIGTRWGHYRGPFFASLPNHLRIAPDPREIREMMRQHRIPCLRFPSATGRGVPLGLYVCNPREYALEKLPRQFRRHVTRGLEASTIRPVEQAELLRDGLQLNLDTMERQRRYDKEFGDPTAWKRFVDAVYRSPGVKVTGAFVDGRLSVYLVSCQQDGCVHMLYKMSRAADYSLPVRHALDYSIVTEAASDPSIELVENSFSSLLPNEGLDAYKRHMGFSIEPYHLSIYLHPVVSPILTSKWALAAVKAAWNRRPKDTRLELGAKILEGARTKL